MSEWLKEHAWKACVGETLPRVRIPLSPPPNLFYREDFPRGVLHGKYGVPNVNGFRCSGNTRCGVPTQNRTPSRFVSPKMHVANLHRYPLSLDSYHKRADRCITLCG